MATPEEIRAMRVAKLEAEANRQKLERESKIQKNNDQIQNEDNELDQSSQSKPSSSSISSTTAVSSPATKPQPTPVQGNIISFERWRASELERIFSVTLSPNDNSPALIYLESLSSDIGSTDLINVDGPDMILTTLIFEQGIRKNFPSLQQYFFKAWTLTADSKRLLQKTTKDYNLKVEFYDEAIRLCSGYASILFYEPDTFIDNPDLNEILAELVNNINKYFDFWLSILNSIVDNQTQLEFLNSILPILTIMIGSSLDSTSLSIDMGPSSSSKYNNILLIVESLTRNKSVCSFIYQIYFFNPNTNDPVQLELDSFLGRILRISPLLSKISAYNYIGILNKNDVNTINESLGTTYSILLNKLFDIVDSLIRINTDSRNEVLKYFSKLINKNHLRMSEHADSKKLSSDSLMLNVTMILFKLAEPILREGKFSKVEKISIDYLNYSNKLIDIEEETRINSTIQESNEYYQNKSYNEEQTLNFVSQCFYLMLTYLQYGLGGLIVSHKKNTKILKQSKAQLKQFEEVLSRNNTMQSNPVAQRLIKMRMDSLKKRVTIVQNDVYSIDMFFKSRNFQIEIFDIIIGVCEFLVRLIDAKHEYHPRVGNFFPYLNIPLHNFDADIEKLDDVEYLRELSPIPFKYFPEIYVEGLINYCHFISKFMNNPMIDNSSRLTKFVEFAIIVLRCPELISNPHLKARLTEVLFFGALPIQTNNSEQNGFMISIFNDDEIVQKNLLISLLDFYVMVEKTGASSQFYDKFNSRYHISFIIEKLWNFNIFKKDLKIIASNYQRFFIRFIARMLNDTTYLLDESLNHLHTIHQCQKELNNRSRGAAPSGEESDEDLNKKLQESERMAKSFVQLSNKTILLFNLFTCETPRSFTIVEIVDRLAGMLNYNLVVLVGPSYNELKVQDPEKYQFDPKELLLQLCSIFINLSKRDEFIEAVARDLRSFNPDNFYKAINILKKSYKLPDDKFEKDLIEFVEKAKVIKAEDAEEELELGEAPDEFLDPLMYTLMKDPVKLPTSKISIDRSVLKAHLMNDPTDPFNRMPLKMEDVSDDVELRDKINAWIQEKRLERRSQRDADGDVAMK